MTGVGPPEPVVGSAGTATCTGLFVGPVPAVVLMVAPPPAGDAAAILTPELEMAGAVGGFGGVFWGKHSMGCRPCNSMNVKLRRTHSRLHTAPQGSSLPLAALASFLGPVGDTQSEPAFRDPTPVSLTHMSMHLANDTECLT